MGENSEPPKMLPPPEEKNKNHILNLSINIEELFLHIPDKVPPSNQEVWHSSKEMSDEYKKLNQTLQVLAMYIARQCNEGPEVKDNINKRLILTRTILGIIIDNLAITGYDCYGMLLEMLQDTFMKISGRRHILSVLSQVEDMKEELAKKQAEGYTS